MMLGAFFNIDNDKPSWPEFEIWMEDYKAVEMNIKTTSSKF